MKYRIFIVEDHPVIRDLYMQIINREADLEVCGTATTGAQALDKIPDLRPDLVLMDIGLPDTNGIEIIRRLLRMMPTLRTLVISGQDEEIYARHAFDVGAKGYLDKENLLISLRTAIHKILQGGLYYRQQNDAPNGPTAESTRQRQEVQS